MEERCPSCPPPSLVGVLHPHRSPLANSTKYSETRFKECRIFKGSEACLVPSEMGRLQRRKEEEESIVSSLTFNSLLSYLVPYLAPGCLSSYPHWSQKSFGMPRGLDITSASGISGLELKGHSGAKSRQIHDTNVWMVQTERSPAMVSSTVTHSSGYLYIPFPFSMLYDLKLVSSSL